MIKILGKNFHAFHLFLFFAIVFLGLLVRLYNYDQLNPFGWDQVDNAWAAEKIIINNDFPLVGMQAKGNSGIFIGPLYYYFVALMYFITDLNPVASIIVGMVSSLFSLIVLFYITTKLFNKGIAYIAIYLYSFATASIIADRIQWPVNLIAPIALLVCYFLFKIITGNYRYIVPLAAIIGLSFHIHFTSIYYIIIVLLALPLFPKSKQSLRYLIYGLIVVLIFISPVIFYLFNNQIAFQNINQYGNSSYHGIHLRRIIQLIGDAFVQFDFYLKYDFLKPLKYLLLPIFLILFNYKRNINENLKLSYIFALFFLVPWIVMSTYSGELSDYYFSTSKFIVIIIISYLIYSIYEAKYILPRIIIILVLFLYGIFGVSDYFNTNVGNPISKHREKALESIERGQKIEFKEGVPESYFYYYYMYKKGIKVY